MAAPQLKRTVDVAGLAPLGAAAAKKRAGAKLTAEVHVVMQALLNGSLMPGTVPESALRMLAAGVPSAFASAVQDRHPVQERILGHIREVFGEAAAALEARIAEAQAAVEAQAQDLATGAARLEAAVAAREAAEVELQERRRGVAEHGEALKAAEAELKAAESEVKLNAQERAGQEKEKEKVTAVEEGGFKVLVEGGWSSEKEAKKVLDKFTKDMEKLETEPSLLASVPAVLLKKPEDRKGFDEMVIGSLRSILAARVAGFDSVLEANESAGKELQAAAGQKRSAAEAARAALAAAKDEVAQASAESAAKEEARAAEQVAFEALKAAEVQKREAAAAAQGVAQRLREASLAFEALASGTAEAVDRSEAAAGGA